MVSDHSVNSPYDGIFTLRSLSKDDGDNNENGKKVIGLD